jgi:hypothetical protein
MALPSQPEEALLKSALLSETAEDGRSGLGLLNCKVRQHDYASTFCWSTEAQPEEVLLKSALLYETAEDDRSGLDLLIQGSTT